VPVNGAAARRLSGVILISAFAGSLVLSSCGGETGGPGSAVIPAPEIGGVLGQELAGKQELHKGNGSEPQTLDPHRAEGVPSSNILRDLFEGLTSEAPDGSVIPGVAKSWQISDDGKVYTFQLRTDARWSNGGPVTAFDFEYSLQRSVDPATLSHYSSILYPIENAEAIISGQRPAADLGVEALDDHTLVIRVNGPTPYLPGLLNHSTTYPVYRGNVEKDGARFARPGNLVSNGAYKLEEWVVQSHIKLTRNEEYWNDADTVINKVVYYAIENQDSELKRYRADELDITEALPYNQLTWIRENLADELVIAPYLGSYYFGYNVTRQPFKDAGKLRQALSLAIDRDIITQRVTGAGEISAYGWVPPVINYEQQRPEWASWKQDKRNDLARRFYSEAGYSKDNPLQVEILYNTNENHKRLTVAVASMWKQVLGVKTSLANQEWKVFLETRRRKEDTEVFRGGWIGDYNDAFTFAQLMYSANEMNHSGYSNARYDALIEQAAGEYDTQKRAGFMQEAERILLEDMPIIPVYFYVSRHLVKPWVSGYQTNIMDHHYSKNLSILKH
jgi:oligopeptide transport system substrate-binding protein